MTLAAVRVLASPEISVSYHPAGAINGYNKTQKCRTGVPSFLERDYLENGDMVRSR